MKRSGWILATLATIAVTGSLAQEPSTAPALPRNVVVPEPPAQPVPFSHRQHAGALELDCQSCHTGALMAEAGDPSAGANMTFPPTDMCIGCHQPKTGDSQALASLADHHARSVPVPWHRLYAIPAGVTWNHRVHIEAGTDCETCHGPVRDLETMVQLTAVTAMASCIGCHEARGAPTSCATCHAWPAGQPAALKGE